MPQRSFTSYAEQMGNLSFVLKKKAEELFIVNEERRQALDGRYGEKKPAKSRTTRHDSLVRGFCELISGCVRNQEKVGVFLLLKILLPFGKKGISRYHDSEFLLVIRPRI